MVLAACLLALSLLGACTLGGSAERSIGPVALGSNALSSPEVGSTSGAETIGTLDAFATTSPTPLAADTLPLCTPTDLSAETRSEGATGSIAISLSISNRSGAACALQGPPAVTLIDSSDQPLNLEIVSLCFLCGPSADGAAPEATLTALAPTQTAVARDLMDGRTALLPGRQVSVFLMWANWCLPFPGGGVRARLTLPGTLGQVTANTDLTAGGRCDVPNAPSRLVVSHYQ